MKFLLCSILDNVTGIYGQPFAEVNSASAIRKFEDLINNPDSIFAKHKEDLSLCSIGFYDEDTGIVEAHPDNVVNTIAFGSSYSTDNPRTVEFKPNEQCVQLS